MTNIFDTLREREAGLSAPIESPEKSARWYMDLIRELGLSTIRSQKLFRSDVGEFVTNIKIGEMYVFTYDPKTKGKLPYYDTVPVVIPFNKVQGGFYALNFHYLPPLIRMRLLTQMLKLADDKDFINNDVTTVRITPDDTNVPGKPSVSETTRLRLNWSLLNNVARFPGVKACVKHYLYPQIDSRIMKIFPKDWKKTVMLPLDNFMNANKQQVYNDSRRKMK